MRREAERRNGKWSVMGVRGGFIKQIGNLFVANNLLGLYYHAHVSRWSLSREITRTIFVDLIIYH